MTAAITTSGVGPEFSEELPGLRREASNQPAISGFSAHRAGADHDVVRLDRYAHENTPARCAGTRPATICW